MFGRAQNQNHPDPCPMPRLPRLSRIALASALVVVLAGCEEDPLERFQSATTAHQTCLAERTYKDECRETGFAVETARLECVKQGLAGERIDAASQLGVRFAKGSEQASPYAEFLKRRKEVIAANLIRANEDQFREDEALARTLSERKNSDQPLSPRQKAEMQLIQTMLEEKYPTYFSEPPNGIETDPEILSIVCKGGGRAAEAQACKRFKK